MEEGKSDHGSARIKATDLRRDLTADSSLALADSERLNCELGVVEL